MTLKTLTILLCAGLGSPLLVQAVEWEPVGSNSSESRSQDSYYYQRQQENTPRYETNTGAQYQYDLNNPVDRNSYSLDLDAQRRDMQSADPRRNTDRSSGQHGGGIYR